MIQSDNTPEVFKIYEMKNEIFSLTKISKKLIVVSMRNSIGILDVDTFELKCLDHPLKDDQYFFDFKFLENERKLIVIVASQLLEKSRCNLCLSAYSIDLELKTPLKKLFEEEFIQYFYVKTQNQFFIIGKDLKLKLFDLGIYSRELKEITELEFINDDDAKINPSNILLKYSLLIHESEDNFSFTVFYEENYKDQEEIEIKIKIFNIECQNGKIEYLNRFNQSRIQAKKHQLHPLRFVCRYI
jgi:hypothetical protein